MVKRLMEILNYEVIFIKVNTMENLQNLSLNLRQEWSGSSKTKKA